jgi:hypothetical protein
MGTEEQMLRVSVYDGGAQLTAAGDAIVMATGKVFLVPGQGVVVQIPPVSADHALSLVVVEDERIRGGADFPVRLKPTDSPPDSSNLSAR